MGGFGYVTAAIVAAVALGSSTYTVWIMKQKEGVTQQELAPLIGTGVVASGGLIVALLNIVAYYTYYRDDLKAWREERRRQTGSHFHTILTRLRKEQGNFEKIRDNISTSGAHRKAVEVFSFELLEAELKKIQHAWWYRSLIRRLLREIDRIKAMPEGAKDVGVFLPLLDRLEIKLQTDVQGYPPPK